MSYKNRFIFILSHEIGDFRFYSSYIFLKNSQWYPKSVLINYQNKRLREIIKYSYKYVPYYNKLFKKLKLTYDDIKCIDDLYKLPILTKKIINDNWNYFFPTNINRQHYINASTGGTTGEPLKYRVSSYDRFFGGAMLYRGWSYGKYILGDKMAFLGGTSLDINPKNSFDTKLNELLRNIKKLSSFEMDENSMKTYIKIINKFKPKYFRGYASSIYFLANWINENNIPINYPYAVFTTAEKLFPHMRKKIENVLKCEVFDGYGLDDGGVSAFECEEHTGLHIDLEKSILEVVNDKNNTIVEGKGKILATSFFNKAMPFIRYNTGDVTNITQDICSCGRNLPLLKELVGRSVDFFITPENKYIHGWFFLYIFWKYCVGITNYQVIQNTLDTIDIYLVINDDFDDKQLYFIENYIKEKSLNWNVNFHFVNKIQQTSSGKYKFIINNLFNT
jgi:phenylacetate-CoA ligase